ncbi:metal-dependent phosphohydrolase [Geomonas silvestris]|uniref:Metal-dependent phosphohydrolase n=2 Tax=Geomonas silvestris TaxID=2740184 RepID=A0A6V8MKB9_9BACT|nr:metal-dependent phosphohydrolase [Geomonas silvestris]
MIGEFGAYQQGVESLTSMTVEDEVLQGLAVLLKKSLHARWAAVYFRDQERTGFDPVRSSGLSARQLEQVRQLPVPAQQIPVLKNLLVKRKYLLISERSVLPLLPAELRQLLHGYSLVAVPMLVRNQVEGVAFVARRAGDPPFTGNDIELTKLMVSHATLLASHISLFNDSLEMSVTMARRSDVIFALDEINKSISSSLSHDQILETAVERIGWIIRTNFISVLGQVKGSLIVQVSRGTGVRVPESFQPGNRLLGRSVAEAAFQSGENQQATALDEIPGRWPADLALSRAGLVSLLAIPLISKETPKGVLLLGRAEAGRFSAEDIFAIEKIAAQVAVALENAKLYEELRELFISTVASLTNAIDAKSPWTWGHSERVMHLSVALANELKLDEALTERVRLGALLHDIGKIGVIDSLLDIKAPLSDSEFVPMRLHPEVGVAILEPIERLREVLPGILHHHEWFDGTGYPKGLKGEEIPLEARVIAVADAFDAMISNRPYRGAAQSSEALAELRSHAGSQFDPRVVAALERYNRKLEQERLPDKE